MALKCPKCQTENTSDSRFCKKCATPLRSSREVDISKTETLLPPREDLTTGTVFAGRYQVVEELGHGGMGKVYKVFDKETNSKVALKLIKPEVAADGNAIERFRNELKVARDISHNHICRMYDLGREADNYFITMEYVSGEDLRSLIRRTRRLDISTAISIAKQVCEGLAEAHRLGVVHRDLKPSNIMIDKEGEAKIMDFGIARSLRTKGITGPGVVIGTPEYMSPEQVDGKEADQRADLYSLSIILYEMVTGTVPFEGETAFAIGLKHKSEPPGSPKKLNPQISDDLSRLILKGLEKDKEKRYQSAAEVLFELTSIEHGLLTTEKVVPRRKALTSREITIKFSLRKFIIPAIAVAIVAIGAVFLIFLSSRQPPKQSIVPSHKQLTFTGDATYPAISPDGKFIAYVTGQNVTESSVWVQDIASGRSIEVFSGDFCQYLRWTPDGSEIAVSGTKDAKPGTFLVPILGGPSRQFEVLGDISWSPEGSQFAGTHARTDTRDDITIITKLTGETTSFNLSGPIILVNDIDWSPFGDRLLVSAFNKEDNYSILTVKTDGSQQNTVVEDNVLLSSPRWSSEGDGIFYLRGDPFGERELWKLPIAKDSGKSEKTPSLVISGIPMGDYFNFSADGKYLLYTRELNFSNLWLAEIEGPETNRTVKTQPLTSGTSLHLTPNISPDGKRVAFSKGNGETMNIYVMPIEGGETTQLTYFNSYNFQPVWSPDGTEIAFGSNEGAKNRVWKISAQGGKPYQFAKTELSRQIFWAPLPSIMYQKLGNRNFMILDPKTEEETPLIEDESLGWIFHPCYSPDSKSLAVSWNRQPSPGLWIISLEDSSNRFIRKKAYPFGWSPDSKWVHAYEEKEGKIDYLMIEAQSGKTKPLPTMSFTIEGQTYHKIIDDKPGVYVIGRIQSDVWVIENFDQIIK